MSQDNKPIEIGNEGIRNSSQIEVDTKQTRRAMVGLLGAGMAGTMVTGAVAQNARSTAPAMMAGGAPASSGETSALLQKIVNNPKTLFELESAGSSAQRHEILAKLGVGGKAKPEDVYAGIQQLLAAHGRAHGKVAPHVFGQNDWDNGGVGPLNRTVEWVAALATAAALFL